MTDGCDMTECILFSGTLNQDGYGNSTKMRYGERVGGAHRIAWVDANGRLPRPGYEICHSCDNPACVNPEHLWEGTHEDNMRDAFSKGRGYVFPQSAEKKARTHCLYGHEYTEENTYNKRNGTRQCRICIKAHYRARVAGLTIAEYLGVNHG